MVKVKMANPGPAALMVINPIRRKKMATKRRKTTTRRSTARRRTTTTKRRNPITTRSRRRSTTYASSRRRSVSRRRNPAATGLLKNAIGIAGGMAGVGLLGMFVPPIGGNSPFAVAGRQAATGYLAGEAMQRLGILRAYANDVKLAGFALGVGTLINAFVMPTVSGFLRPAPKADKSNSNGMGDIVTLPRGSWDDYYGSTPNFRTNAASGRTGMNGVITMPRVSGY